MAHSPGPSTILLAMNRAELIEIYEHALPGLLKDHRGKYALVCVGEILIFDTAQEAIDAGFEKCGRPNDFYVSRIEP